jgi:hypothetical protein
MKRKAEIRIKGVGRQQQTRSSWLPLVAVIALASLVFVFTSYVLNQAYDGAKGTFLLNLSEEKRAADLNRHLKMEIAAVTRKSYVEFVAEERLGLKKPKEEEVLVLR